MYEYRVDFRRTDENVTWKATDIHSLFGSAGGVILYRRVSVTEVMWVGETLKDVGGGVGVVEVHHC
jgi:hypothetical protein